MTPYIVAAVVAILVAVIGGLATDVGPWYRELKKPPWNPPDWLFGPAWTVIYSLTVWAAGLTWIAAPEGSRWWTVALPFLINAVLNALWSVVFFGMKSPERASIEVIFLWLSTASLVLVGALYSSQAALLLLVYLAWVTFASALNFSIVKRNKPILL